MRLTFWYTMYIMKNGDKMIDLKNIKDHILNDVLLLGEDDIWNVIFAIDCRVRYRKSTKSY